MSRVATRTTGPVDSAGEVHDRLFGRALDRTHDGAVERLIRPSSDPGSERRHYGLTERESQVLSLISRGLSNQQIAELCYLSINSVKSYIRTAYRRIGVQTRAQAVRWGVLHGMDRLPLNDRTGRLAPPA